MSYHKDELLPIRFDFSIARATWTAISVEAVEWSNSGPLNLVAEIPGRVNPLGHVSRIHFAEEHVPPSVKAEFQSGGIKRRRGSWLSSGETGTSRVLTVLECRSIGEGAKSRKCDPRQLRNEFLTLKEDTKLLLGFLNRYGAWRPRFSFGRWFDGSPATHQRTKEQIPIIVPPHAFWHYRSTLRTRLEKAMKKPAQWFATTLNPPALKRISEYPFHSYRLNYALDVLEASITFDLLQKTPMSLCARDDCRKLFPVSRPDKIFCSEKCARCMVTRRSRALKKSQKPKG